MTKDQYDSIKHMLPIFIPSESYYVSHKFLAVIKMHMGSGEPVEVHIHTGEYQHHGINVRYEGEGEYGRHMPSYSSLDAAPYFIKESVKFAKSRGWI